MVAALAATSLVAAQAQEEFKPKAGDVTTDIKSCRGTQGSLLLPG